MIHKMQRGITLIELLIFIIVVSVGLLGAIAVFGPAVRGSADPMIRKQTLNLAEALLREVMQKSFENDPADPNNTSNTLGCTPNTVPVCTANSQVSRPLYNDVDDYIGFNQVGILRLNGANVPGLEACTEAVAVTPTTINAVAGKLITATVRCGGETVPLSAFRSNYGG